MVIKSERLPAPGETVLGGTFLMNAGGKGANQAVAAARLGGDVTLVARVGNDLFGTQSIEQFKKENINTRFISIDKNHPSGIALINVDAKGENCITVAPGANGQIFPQTLDSFFKAKNINSLVVCLSNALIVFLALHSYLLLIRRECFFLLIRCEKPQTSPFFSLPNPACHHLPKARLY
jgi:sugar/nucleoside kinase (ribokinase family)